MFFIQTEEISVVVKTYLLAGFFCGISLLHQCIGPLQPPQDYIVPRGKTGVLFESMGQIGWSYMKLGSHKIYRDVFRAVLVEVL